MSELSGYYSHQHVSGELSAGNHRDLIGGLWEEVGKLQLDVARRNGLEPNHKLLDLGCGCLRGGVHFVQYLEAGN